MKKKREKCIAPENAKLKIPAEFHCNDDDVQTLLVKLRESDSFEVQQHIITEVSVINEFKMENYFFCPFVVNCIS